ncbi:glycosyltransferase family 39 protein [Amycolatopsis acidiphila]|uniref:Glycosyltransferase family 39 protein n=1 Tax=Amycolatopsis acidiphila TaxID=715473 RepID=A0A558AKH4_9PSEU|nr:glycosyltransferase family 39 protein [Amycolatopsis acidiphila]TVT24775.1 glycosyltransferase family 39 protein [Amycolatopsis acidiphila]UIJ62744.1 glycosyltransferase family 39 protein [Amycolatopsis acidiphila]GHG63924.1 hypothetical protein GCM10017788_20220 [Amycolatopsis acidiphila]
MTTSETLPRFARLPVLAIAAVAGGLLLWTSTRYGHGFDETYFVMAGRNHPAWGYFDQPPLVPMLAAGLDRLFPGSLLALRLPVTLAAVGGIVLTALIARELGGRRGAQAMAAAFYAMSGTITISHWLATYSLDPVLWTLVAWLLVRWVRRRDSDRPLFWAGVVTAVSLEVKFLIPAFWVLVLLSALLLGPRELLRRPALWQGALAAVAATVPTLVWQARHDWAYTRMSQVVAAESPGYWGFLRDGLLSAGIGVGVLAFLFGLWSLLRSPRLRDCRFLGLATVAAIVAFLLLQGRANYVFGLFAVPFAAAATELARYRFARWKFVWPAFALSAVTALVALPVYPLSTVDKLPTSWGPFTIGAAFAQGERPVEQLGQLIAGSYASLPPEVRAHTAVYAEIYPFASAAEYQGIPVYSGHRAYWYFGPPPEDVDNVLFAGFDPKLLSPYFSRTTTLVDGLMWLETGRTKPWAQFWPTLRTQ